MLNVRGQAETCNFQHMKTLFQLFVFAVFSTGAFAQSHTDTAALRQSLDKATAAIRDAFGRGDAAMVGRLHHPDVIKYFGGNNVIVGRDAVEKGARDWFANS